MNRNWKFAIIIYFNTPFYQQTFFSITPLIYTHTYRHTQTHTCSFTTSNRSACKYEYLYMYVCIYDASGPRSAPSGNVAEKLVARSECYLHKRDKTRSTTIWRSIKVTDSAGPSPWRPGEFVRARQPALVIPDNVKCPLSRASPPTADHPRSTVHRQPFAPLSARRPVTAATRTRRHRRLSTTTTSVAATAAAAADSFVRSRRQSNFSSAKQTLRPSVATHSHTYAQTPATHTRKIYLHACTQTNTHSRA